MISFDFDELETMDDLDLEAIVETEMPCVGVPVPGGPLNGVDALLAMTQVPGGVPVGCVGLHSKAPLNAAMYAYRILKFAGLE